MEFWKLVVIFVIFGISMFVAYALGFAAGQREAFIRIAKESIIGKYANRLFKEAKNNDTDGDKNED